MLLGCDLSHWNDPRTFNYAKAGEFALIKASEGASYKDACVMEHYANAREHGMLKGLYHYARAERNAPDVEATLFVSVTQKLPSDVVLALDIEGECWKNANIDEWAVSFCTKVKEVTGIVPLIYVSAAYAYKLPKCAKLGCGLWLAWYNNEPERVRGKYTIPWDAVQIHQYSNTPYDKNAFFGNRDAWLKLAGVHIPENVHSGDDVSDAERCAELLNELEMLVYKYKSL